MIGGAGDPIAGDVEMVVSELVSNVVQHTNGGGTLRVWDPNPDVPLRVEIADGGNGVPRSIPLSEATPSGGRGLRIVNDLSDNWGVEYGRHGKTVWVEFDRDAR